MVNKSWAYLSGKGWIADCICESILIIKCGDIFFTCLIIITSSKNAKVWQIENFRYKKQLQKKSNERNLVEYKIRTLRHFADFMAWQIF